MGFKEIKVASSNLLLDGLDEGDNQEPVVGGFQVLEQIEVGPLLMVGDGAPVRDEEFAQFEVSPVPTISCARASICKQMARLREEYQEAKARDGENVIFGGQ